jgi:hypothetical protein
MKINEILTEAANPAQQAAIAISMKKANKKPKTESTELEEEFDLIESIIERLAEHNGVDAEVIWEDLETLTEDELYAFAVTSEPIMESQGVAEAIPYALSAANANAEYERTKTFVPHGYKGRVDTEVSGQEEYRLVMASLKKLAQEEGQHIEAGLSGTKMSIFSKTMDEQALSDFVDMALDNFDQGVAEDWQKANKRDKTDGMSQKAVNAYRRENPGSKLKTAVTTKPSKLKKGGKASKRRKSYCSRSRGQMKMHSISCAKTPDKAICKARRRWNC